MIKYFKPLGVFISGNILMLFLFLFFSAFGTAATQLQSDTAGIASTFWAWDWAVTNIRLWVYISVELTILFFTAKAFLAVKD